MVAAQVPGKRVQRGMEPTVRPAQRAEVILLPKASGAPAALPPRARQVPISALPARSTVPAIGTGNLEAARSSSMELRASPRLEQHESAFADSQDLGKLSALEVQAWEDSDQQQMQIEMVNQKFLKAIELINSVSESTEAQLDSLQRRFDARFQELVPLLQSRASDWEKQASERERGEELVKVTAALCSDIQALQGTVGKSSAELEALQSQHSLDMKEMRSRHCASMDKVQGQLSTCVREVDAKFGAEVQQLACHLETLQGVCETNAGSIEALTKGLQSEGQQASPQLLLGLEERQLELDRQVEALRREMGERFSSLETFREEQLDAFESLRSAVQSSLAEASQESLRREQDALQQSQLACQQPDQQLLEEACERFCRQRCQELVGELSPAEAVRSELRGELEALRDELASQPQQAALDSLRRRCQGDLETVHASLRSEVEELKQAPSRWGFLGNLQSQLGCDHSRMQPSAVQATAPHGAQQQQSTERQLESLRSEAQEREQDLEALQRRQGENAQKMREFQRTIESHSRLLEGLPGQLTEGLGTLREQLEAGLEAAQERHREASEALKALQTQQGTASAGLQALRSQQTRVMTVQEQLLDDVGALKSQLVDNLQLLQDQGSSQANSIEALQSGQQRQAGGLEALRGELGLLAQRQDRGSQELRAARSSLGDEIEELRSKQTSSLPLTCQV